MGITLRTPRLAQAAPATPASSGTNGHPAEVAPRPQVGGLFSLLRGSAAAQSGSPVSVSPGPTAEVAGPAAAGGVPRSPQSLSPLSRSPQASSAQPNSPGPHGRSGSLEGEGGATIIQLKPLSEEDVRELAFRKLGGPGESRDAWAGEPTTKEFLSTLADAQGVPLVVGELIRLWRQRHKLVKEGPPGGGGPGGGGCGPPSPGLGPSGGELVLPPSSLAPSAPPHGVDGEHFLPSPASAGDTSAGDANAGDAKTGEATAAAPGGKALPRRYSSIGESGLLRRSSIGEEGSRTGRRSSIGEESEGPMPLLGANLLGHILRLRLDSTSMNARLAVKVRGVKFPPPHTPLSPPLWLR